MITDLYYYLRNTSAIQSEEIMAMFVNVPQNGIKHKAARPINNSEHWLRTLIAALCFISFCGHNNKYYGRDNFYLNTRGNGGHYQSTITPNCYIIIDSKS